MNDMHLSQQMPTRFVITDVDTNVAGFCCPVCGCKCVHLEQAMVEQGRTKTIIGRESTTVMAIDNCDGRSGSAIVLRFWCEAMHRFEYRYQFHKGITRCMLSRLSWPIDGQARELWRD